MKPVKITQGIEHVRIGLAKSLYRTSVPDVRTRVNRILFAEQIEPLIVSVYAINGNVYQS